MPCLQFPGLIHTCHGGSVWPPCPLPWLVFYFTFALGRLESLPKFLTESYPELDFWKLRLREVQLIHSRSPDSWQMPSWAQNPILLISIRHGAHPHFTLLPSCLSSPHPSQTLHAQDSTYSAALLFPTHLSYYEACLLGVLVGAKAFKWEHLGHKRPSHV